MAEQPKEEEEESPRKRPPPPPPRQQQRPSSMDSRNSTLEASAGGEVNFVYTTPDGWRISFATDEYSRLVRQGFRPEELDGVRIPREMFGEKKGDSS